MRRLLLSLLLLCVLASTVWLAGFAWFVSLVPESPGENDMRTDAIVVLTGGGERVARGIALLAEGRASRLFVSGVGKSVTPGELLALPESRRMAKYIANPGEAVVLGYEADSTRENAAETARWMAKQHFTSLRLVTAAYHMPRSLFEFRSALPSVLIVPEPVFPSPFHRDAWWDDPLSRRLPISEYHKLLGRIAHGWLAILTEENA